MKRVRYTHPQRRRSAQGQALVEFALVGVPIIFIVISTFEVARAMWVYHTLAYAAKEATRYTVVRGNDSSSVLTVAAVAAQIQYAGLGLDPAKLQVKLVSDSQTIDYQTLQSALTKTTTDWPASAAGDIGANPGHDVEVDLKYNFQTAMSFFWPSSGPAKLFGPYTFPASSKEQIQY